MAEALDGAFADRLPSPLDRVERGRAELRNGLATVVFLLGATMAHAHTSSQDLIKAIETWDVRALQALADQTSDTNQRRLARGVLKAFAGKDAAAINLLEGLLASRQLDDGLRFVAFNELGTLHLRNQHYIEAVRAFESALGLSGSVPIDAMEELEDALRYARAHVAIPPMTVAVKSLEPSPVTRDAMDLPRVSAKINGHRVDAILDTGASNSVVSLSSAKRLHLRMLRFESGVAAGGGQVSARFAVADTLLFAGRDFRNVPFIVLPDEAVSVPLDQWVARLEPIIGLSVLRKLGRLEIVQHDGQERLRAGGSSTTGVPPNLLLPNSLPIVLVRVGPAGTELRMSLDTGANRSALAPAALSAFPALAGGATQGSTRMLGAGGISPDDAATILPQLTLRVGDVTSQLSKVPVAPGPDNCEGTLGQDVLRSGGGYVIDFDRMTVEILPTT